MPTPRTPLAIANWKMAMTVSESLAFLQEFHPLAGESLERVEVVLCPPVTAIRPMDQFLKAVRLPGWKISLGAQDVSAETEIARTGQVSGALLAEAGCRWVMLGHWELRRHLGDDDAIVNRKLQRALDAGLYSLLLVGPGAEESHSMENTLSERLSRILSGYSPDQIAPMAFVYEAETSIGRTVPLESGEAAEGCRLIRRWLGLTYGDRIADAVRILYGGSVLPERAQALLASPEIDGLGASRQGRDPAAFALIVRLVDQVKAASSRELVQASSS